MVKCIFLLNMMTYWKNFNTNWDKVKKDFDRSQNFF